MTVEAAWPPRHALVWQWICWHGKHGLKQVHTGTEQLPLAGWAPTPRRPERETSLARARLALSAQGLTHGLLLGCRLSLGAPGKYSDKMVMTLFLFYQKQCFPLCIFLEMKQLQFSGRNRLRRVSISSPLSVEHASCKGQALCLSLPCSSKGRWQSGRSLWSPTQPATGRFPLPPPDLSISLNESHRRGSEGGTVFLPRAAQTWMATSQTPGKNTGTAGPPRPGCNCSPQSLNLALAPLALCSVLGSRETPFS